MTLTEMQLELGKRGLDDKVKIESTGYLVEPDTRSNILILLQAGFLGKPEDYIPHFAEQIGKEVNVYVSPLRNRGLFVKNALDDHLQTYEQVRNRTEADIVIPAGHSMGMNVSVASVEKNDLQVAGIYGLAAYPSLGDTRTRDGDPDKKSLQHKLVDLFGSIVPLSPLQYPLREANIDETVRFAIAENDEVLGIRNRPEVAERNKRILNEQFDSTSRTFGKKNHCFNYGYLDLAPFNKDDSQPLIDDVLDFADKSASEYSRLNTRDSKAA